ncbi:MAG: glycosyltransferase family 2 protein [Alphaproteobacteria bacterium]
MRVSIVTVSFNQQPYLERALRSVLEQDHDDIEYIVVDPGSSDGSREVIASFGDRIDRVILDPDDGPADGLNHGFAQATGEILAYLNADDVLLPGAVRQAVAVFSAEPQSDVVVGHGWLVDHDEAPVRRFRSARFSLWRYAHGAAVVMQQATFFRRSIFLAAGGFNPANRTSWDAELLVRMALAGGRVRTVDRTWALFRLHGQSITGSGRLSEAYAADHRRYQHMILGRDRRWYDRPAALVARIWRWLLDPVGLMLKLRDAVVGLPGSLT